MAQKQHQNPYVYVNVVTVVRHVISAVLIVAVVMGYVILILVYVHVILIQVGHPFTLLMIALKLIVLVIVKLV